jgi:hypothetical protein
MTHLKPRSATKVLYQGDDMARLAELARAVSIAKRQAEEHTGAERGGDTFTGAVTEAQRAYDEAVDEAATRAIEVTFQSIGRRRFAEIVEKHPPRMVPKKDETGAEVEGVEVEDPNDESWGVNTETFPRALLTFRDGDYVTLAEPKFGSAREVEDFIDDELAEGDYDELWIAALMLNRSPSADPKALRGPSMNGSPSTDET